MQAGRKSCPRCHNEFECKAGDILECQCYGIQISAREDAFIKSKYTGCLCRNCLKQLKNRYHLFIKKKMCTATGEYPNK